MTKTWIELKGKKCQVELGADAPVRVDGVAFDVDFEEIEPGVVSLLWTDAYGRVRSFRCVADGDAVVIDGERVEYGVWDPRSLRGTSAGASESGPKALKAPMPGRIVKVLVAVGETVAAGQGCVVMEAMKMQNELKAPRAGVVGKVSAAEGETVAAGAVLVVVE